MKAKRDHLAGREAFIVSLILSLVFSICGCSKPPTGQQLAGSWNSADGRYAMSFRNDGTFSFKTANVQPTSFSDLADTIGFSCIAPSGQWQLNKWELDLSCVSSTPNLPINIQLKVVSWNASTLVLRFGNGNDVRFVRQK